MSRYRLFYHFVWATKLRLLLITDANRDAIYNVIGSKVRQANGIVHAINGMPDHVHVVATLPPTSSSAAIERAESFIVFFQKDTDFGKSKMQGMDSSKRAKPFLEFSP